MKERTVVWKRVDYPGMEHFAILTGENQIAIGSVVIGVVDGEAFRLDYVIHCEPNYTVRTVNLSMTYGSTVRLTSDGRGNWFDGEGNPLLGLAGCIDVDITATPFTNTLPIKRIKWTPGQSETLRMVYFLIPEMTFQADEQRYTCIDMRKDGATFRFEQVSTGFTALLPVDADGLVLDYPGLFERAKAS